jgi:hypothetical protein
MDVPSTTTTYIVRSFARPEESDSSATPGATDRWTAKVWNAANVAEIPDAYLQRARQKEAATWYTLLSNDEVAHWLEYYAEEFYARRGECTVPEAATRLLEQAVEQGCFESFTVLFNPEHRHFALFGLYSDQTEEVYVPIVAWHPESDPLPTAEQLKTYFEEAEADEVAANAYREADRKERQREHDARAQKERRRSRKIALVHWGITLPVLVMVIVLFYLVIGWWALMPAVIICIAAWVLHNEYRFDQVRSLRRGLASLSVVSVMALAAAWLQLGTVTKPLTLCSKTTYSNTYGYKTPEGDEYSLTPTAYDQLLDTLPNYASAGAVKVVAEVDRNTFVGDPQVVSLRVVGDAWDTCSK